MRTNYLKGKDSVSCRIVSNVAGKAFMLALGVLMSMGCESNEELFTDSPTSSSSLRVTTREGETTTSISQGRIYIFNSSENCINILSTDEVNTTASVSLNSGKYSVYALGSTDLSQYTLPDINSAKPSSLIKVGDNKSATDLLSTSKEVTLGEGGSENLSLLLDRKVLCIDALEIKDVPDDVTKIEVEISPVYSAMRLDGAYPNETTENSTEAYKVELAQTSISSIWKAEPQKMLFPSKGKPIVRIFLTRGTKTKSYYYTATEEMVANHHYSISGTYQNTEEITLNAHLSAKDWNEDSDITFNFDRYSNSSDTPEAQKFYNGYYVVKVDDTTGKALLLSKTEITYTAPSGTSSSDWLAALNSAISSVEKPDGTTSSWRLPTLEEANLFLQDSQVVTHHTVTKDGNSSVMTGSFFCTDNNELKWLYLILSTSPVTQMSGNKYSSSVVLRPVIEL